MEQLEMFKMMSQYMASNRDFKIDDYSDVCDYYWDMAFKQFNKRKWHDVKSYTDKIINIKSQCDDEFVADALTLSAIAEATQASIRQKSNYSKITGQLEEALSKQPDSTWTKKALVLCYIRSGNIKKACDLWAANNLDFDSSTFSEAFGKDSCIIYDKAFSLRDEDFYVIAYKVINNNVNKDYALFDYMYELHRRYPKACDYMEMLSAVGNSTGLYSRIVSLYEDYFKIRNIENTGYQNYLMMLCEYINVLCSLKDLRMIEKILAKLDEAYAIIEQENEQIGDMCESMYIACRINALSQLGKDKEIIEYSNNIDGKYINNKILSYRAQALSNIGEPQKALELMECVSVLGLDYAEYTNLGDIYFSLEKYAEAEEAYKAAINYINTGRDERLIELTPSFYPDKQEYLQKIFKRLMNTLIYEEKYVDYEAVYRIMCKTLPDSTKDKDIAMEKLIKEKLIGREMQLQETIENINIQLNDNKLKLQQYSDKYKQWYELMLRCQVLNDKEITDEIWQKDFEGKIGLIVDDVIKNYSKTVTGEYLTRIEETFPELDEVNKKVLATADRMYDVFFDEKIDFAPVIIEYGRFFEAIIWKYYDNNMDTYREIIQAQRGYGNSLGKARLIAQAAYGTPIYHYREEIAEICNSRNMCAHAAKDRFPNAERIHNIVWRTKLVSFLLNS